MSVRKTKHDESDKRSFSLEKNWVAASFLNKNIHFSKPKCHETFLIFYERVITMKERYLHVMSPEMWENNRIVNKSV